VLTWRFHWSVPEFLKPPIMNKKNKDSFPWGKSLRYLDWDGKSEKLTPSKSLISSTVHEWYDAKHRKKSPEEICFINSIIPAACPYCRNDAFVKRGKAKGIQRYRCSSCGRTFTPMAGTIFQDIKIPISEWTEFLLHLFEHHSIKTTARDNRNAKNTGKYWLVKTFLVLRGIQDKVMLGGRIQLDETSFSVVRSKVVKKDGKKLRGISRNRIAVAVAKDDSGSMVFLCEYTSKPSNESTWRTLGGHIMEGSHLIHDGEHSHECLVRNRKLTQEIHKSRETKGLQDKDNPLSLVNHLHFLIKDFMKTHGGFTREEIQDWMNLAWFLLSKPENRYEKVDKFMNMAAKCSQNVKYRQVFKRKLK